MQDSRRTILMTLFGAAASFAASPLLRAQRTVSPQPIPSPNAPDPHNPGGLDGMQATKDSPATKAANQQQIREDVQKLYEMVSALKKQVEATDLNATLPVTVVKQAQQIEKLAKQIKERAKG